MVPSLDVYTSSLIIETNWISPNQIPSQLVSFVRVLWMWAACRWAPRPPSKGVHVATLICSLGRAQTSAACLLFLTSIFCWGCRAAKFATSSLLLPRSTHPQTSKASAQGRQRMLSGHSFYLAMTCTHPPLSHPICILHHQQPAIIRWDKGER